MVVIMTKHNIITKKIYIITENLIRGQKILYDNRKSYNRTENLI